ncbi:unnamed protein product [Leptidea sinapis]|uniref:Uncharacterized protein n=1 Tax=Leptidea sinapis TaxID=189913 RepID=A0A5E4QMJ9_9NEOP|nr:unnamed protein product [Leptidea sinapis]
MDLNMSVEPMDIDVSANSVCPMDLSFNEQCSMVKEEKTDEDFVKNLLSESILTEVKKPTYGSYTPVSGTGVGKTLTVSLILNEINLKSYYVKFDNLKENSLRKCIEFELGGENKINDRELNNIMKYFDVSVDGCKGVHNKMKYYKK